MCFFAHSAEQLRVTGYTGNLNAPSNMDTSQLGVEQQLVLMQLNQLNGVNTPSLGAASSLSASLSVSQQLDAATAAAAGLGGGGGGGLPHHLSASLNGSLSGQLPSVHSGQLLQLGQLNGMASVHSGQLPTMHSASLPVVSSQLSGPLPTVSEQQELIMQLQRQQRQQQQHQQQQQQLASLQQMVKDAAGMQGGGSRGRLSPTTPLLSPHSPNPYTGSPASSGSTSRAASGGTVGAMEGDGGDGGMLASLQAQLSGMQLPGAGSGGLDAAVTSMALPVSAAQQLGGHGGVMMSQPDLSSSEGLLAALAQQLGFMPNGSVAQCTAAQGGGAFGSLYAGPLSMPLPQLTELSPAVAANAALAGLPRGGGGVSSAAHMAGGFGASSADPLVLLSSLPRRGASSAPGSPSGQLEAGLDGWVGAVLGLHFVVGWAAALMPHRAARLCRSRSGACSPPTPRAPASCRALPAPGLGQQAMGMAAAASSTAALQLLPIDDDEDENESQDGEDITERDQVRKSGARMACACAPFRVPGPCL